MVEGCVICGRKVCAKNLCSRHYQQRRWRLRKVKSLQRIRRRFSLVY